MKAKRLKKPSDYPQFYCRMSQEDKMEIEEMLTNIATIENKIRLPNNRTRKRNEFITKALKLGLRSIERKYEEALAKRKPSKQ